MPRACLSLLLAFFIVTALSARAKTHEASVNSPSLLAGAVSPDALHAYLEACESFGFSGSVLVARGGKKILSEGFGLADRDKKVRNDPATCFEIASATKSFTAIAVLQLAQAGKLALDDSIAKHLPGVPKGMADITIRHLLNHTSGMPRSAAGGHGDDLEKAVAGYFSTPRAHKPGATYEYWNGGYALLAGIVERASGTTYMAWCHEHIFDPAGMKTSGFTGEKQFESTDVAIGYELGKPPRRADEHPYDTYGWQYRGMGGIVTTVEDMYRFDRALRSEVLLTKKWRAEMLKPALENYACGFEVIDKPQKRIGHGGDVRGFHAQYALFPEDDAAIIVLCNVSGVPTWAVAENLQALLFGNPARYPIPPTAESAKATDVTKLVGTYASSPDEQIAVRVEGNALLLSAAGVEATRILWTDTTSSWKEPDRERIESAKKLVESVSHGDPEPLRRCMNPTIPADWPDEVVSTMWPKHVEKWGELKSVRVASATADAGSTTVLLALEHARGNPRLKIVFQGDRLQIFDLAGPESLASSLAIVGKNDRLLRFAWTGEQPSPITIVRDASHAVTALRFEGKGPAQVFKRQKD